ncbi:hypothetical protein CABS01_11271 [Colletotrichum abscissum]|uniref:uncharacterized protein n=1 Tax=Colletotrichum abscissum TaxID=1671311 RepID=UPI0027D4EE48|nr:uncharacterized protein CABS01_11271 [Colletotrichum abscissum]KAK1495043.1 hypothetical protein CABS01_11271 [Colletotrichum abscissum]
MQPSNVVKVKLGATQFGNSSQSEQVLSLLPSFLALPPATGHNTPSKSSSSPVPPTGGRNSILPRHVPAAGSRHPSPFMIESEALVHPFRTSQTLFSYLCSSLQGTKLSLARSRVTVREIRQDLPPLSTPWMPFISPKCLVLLTQPAREISALPLPNKTASSSGALLLPNLSSFETNGATRLALQESARKGNPVARVILLPPIDQYPSHATPVSFINSPCSPSSASHLTFHHLIKPNS